MTAVEVLEKHVEIEQVSVWYNTMFAI